MLSILNLQKWAINGIPISKSSFLHYTLSKLDYNFCCRINFPIITLNHLI